MSNSKDASKVMKQIDENLKRVYRDMDDEPVPDRFEALLQKLKEQDQRHGQ